MFLFSDMFGSALLKLMRIGDCSTESLARIWLSVWPIFCLRALVRVRLAGNGL